MPPPQALILARQKGLDLVEISPTAVPPVCRIMDYGKYQYQEQKRAREAKRHQKVIEVKEIKFRPKVDEHDYQFKKHHIERFIEDGDKVKATIFFRGREMAHPEIGHRILMRLTLAGAIYITLVCLLPEFLVLEWNVPFYFGGTSLLIIVVVTMDFMSQVQAYIMSNQYESLLKKTSFKGLGSPGR